jgi:hypothetical protein
MACITTKTTTTSETIKCDCPDGCCLNIIPVQTTMYTPNNLEFVPMAPPAASDILKLPASPVNGFICGTKLVAAGPLAIFTSGTDTFNIVGGPNLTTIAALNTGCIMQYDSSIGVWYIISTSTF